MPPKSVILDINEVRLFIEAVMWDEATIAAGLWQGEMPVRALEAADRVKDFLLRLEIMRPEELLSQCPTSE